MTLRRATIAVLAAVLMSSAGGTSAQGPASAPAAKVLATRQLGMNVEALVDFGRSFMFVDVMKAARHFGTPGTPWDEKAKVDANGWPTEDAGVVVMADVSDIGGTYKFSCTGRTTVELNSTEGSIDNLKYDSGTNTTTADVIVAKTANQFFLSFRNTDGGIKNVKLLRPGYADDKQTFTNEFVAFFKPFTTLRTMDLTRTNNNAAVKWDDRAKKDDATQASTKGVAWEYCIEMANTMGKDLWVNVPAKADDDYVRSLAKLLKANLKKDRVVYVEYSNEVWNTIFAQSGQNFDAAKAEAAAGDTKLTDGGNDNNQYFWAWKRVAKKTVRISDIFREVYGDGAMMTTVRPVLAAQSAQPFMLGLQLEYVDKQHGPPNKYIYAVAGAPYFGVSEEASQKKGLTLDEVFTKYVPESIGWSVDSMRKYTGLGKAYGLHSFCYEGGPGMDGDSNLDVKLAANRDKRIGDAVNTYLDTWWGTGGELFCYYASSGAYTKSGCWGMTEDIRKPSAKTKGVEKLFAQPAPEITFGARVPGDVLGTKFAYNSGGGTEKSVDGGENLAFLGAGNTFDYLVVTPASGDFTVAVNAASGGTSGKVEVICNGKSAGVVDVPNTGGYQTWGKTAPVTVTLPVGQSGIRLKIVNGGMNVRGFTVEKK